MRVRKLAVVLGSLLVLLGSLGRAFAADGVTTVPWDRMLTNGVSVTAGLELTEYRQLICDRLGNRVTYERYLPNSVVATDTMPAAWQGVPGTADAPGDYPVTCVPASPEVLKPFTITLHIVPPNTPHIVYAGDAGDDVLLQFLRPIEDAEHIALFVSDDGGKRWRDTAGMPGSFVTERNANVSGLKKDRTYWFQLMVEGGPMAGRSKALEFPWYANMADYNGGGDRDLGDRDGQSELPPAGDVIPPPETNGGDSSAENSTSAAEDAPSEPPAPETEIQAKPGESPQPAPPVKRPAPVSTLPSHRSEETMSATDTVPDEPQSGIETDIAVPASETETPAAAPSTEEETAQAPPVTETDDAPPALPSEPASEPESVPAPSDQPPLDSGAESVPAWPVAGCTALALGGAAALGWQRGRRKR